MSLPKFKNQNLKETAFTHRSYLNETSRKKLSSNERLEFLGDSILSLIVSGYLYQNFPQLEEGDLTNLRAALVRTQTLAKVAKKLKLGPELKLSHGEEESGGRNNPTLLTNTFEALIGALYLDQGIEVVNNFVRTNLLSELEEIIKKGTYKDFKSRFQEIVQEKKRISPVYRVLESSGPDHAKRFLVGVYVGQKLWGKGQGSSKREAEQNAAQLALEKLGKIC